MSRLVSIQVKGISKFKKRRRFSLTCAKDYLESDRDYVENNMALCIEFLGTLEKRKLNRNESH